MLWSRIDCMRGGSLCIRFYFDCLKRRSDNLSDRINIHLCLNHNIQTENSLLFLFCNGWRLFFYWSLGKSIQIGCWQNMSIMIHWGIDWWVGIKIVDLFWRLTCSLWGNYLNYDYMYSRKLNWIASMEVNNYCMYKCLLSSCYIYRWGSFDKDHRRQFYLKNCYMF